MKNPNAIDPLIRKYQEQQVRPAADFDAIIAEHRYRQARSYALDNIKLTPGLGLPFNEVIGISKIEGTDTPHFPTHIVEVDPNILATKLSEAAWDSLPNTKDSPEFSAFAARLRNPASLALDNVTHVDFVHQDTTTVIAQKQAPSEIAS